MGKRRAHGTDASRDDSKKQSSRNESFSEHHNRRASSNKRLRERKAHHQSDVEPDDSIEAQLQLQRVKQKQLQQAKQQENPSEKTAARPERLGDFYYDEKRGTYFPKSHLPDYADEESDILNVSSPAQYSTYPYSKLDLSGPFKRSSFLSWAVAGQTCSSTRQRSRLVSLWRGQGLLESTKFTHSFRDRNGDQDLFLGTYNNASSDITCKTELPAWKRTFDVFQHDNECRMLPDIATLQKEGLGIYRYNLFSRLDAPAAISCLRYIGCGSKSGQLGLVLCYENHSELGFSRSSAIGRSTNLYITRHVNDFGLVEFDKLIMACNCNSTSRSRKRRNDLVFTTLHDGATYFSSNSSIPVSDMLCVEPLKEKRVCFGHLNGQVTLFDTRAHAAVSTRADQAFSNILSMNALRDNELLARGSSGFCRLYDLRKLGSVSREVEPSVVHEFRPPVPFNSLFTSKCNGVATDPYHSVVISPFVSEAMDPQLGMWSLYSGDYIGSKPLAQDLDDASKQYMNIELCKTRTRAFRWSDDSDDAVSVAGAFGLWYKLAHWEDDNDSGISATSSHIHHVYFD
jgi:hypothetical protein